MHRNQFPTTQSPTPNPLHAEHIQKMFNEAGLKISCLLQQLSALYKAFGVRYNVMACYETLFRMLTPFQLLTHFGIKSVGNLVDFGYFNRSFVEGVEGKFGITRTMPYNYENFFVGHSYETSNERNAKEKKNKLPNESRIFNIINNYRPQQNQSVQARKKVSVNCRKNSLMRNQEIALQKYIIDEVKKGSILTMQQISDEARKIGRSQNFLGSLGWVKHFLKRYPEMRDLYTYSRMHKNKFRDEGYIEMYRPQIDSDQQQIQNNEEDEGEENNYRTGDQVDEGSVYQDEESQIKQNQSGSGDESDGRQKSIIMGRPRKNFSAKYRSEEVERSKNSSPNNQ